MKIRVGFVTNSSSSSFTIMKSTLTDAQVECLLHGKQFIWSNVGGDSWFFYEKDGKISGVTDMDNREITRLFKENGISGVNFSKGWGDPEYNRIYKEAAEFDPDGDFWP